MKSRLANMGATERGGRLVPVALTLAALAPVLCVLWFMSLALRNERLAVRERLTQVYNSHLEAAQRAVEVHWQARLDRLKAVHTGLPAERFAAVVATWWRPLR